MLSARLAALLHPLGALALGVFGAPAAAAFAVLHGAGNGILTIAKGTLPLVLFGPAGYGHRQGWLMVPARIAQALAPWLFGLLLDRWGAQRSGSRRRSDCSRSPRCGCCARRPRRVTGAVPAAPAQ